MPPSLNHRILTIILAPLQSFPYASGSGNPNPKARPFHCPFRRRSTEYVLIPSESKMLHLYEARYLALLEESLLERKGLFVHFVMEPVLTDRSSSGTSFAAIYGCLVLIENVSTPACYILREIDPTSLILLLAQIDRLDIGALVSIRGIGRVSIVDLIQLEPYFRGVVIPYQDNAYAVVGEMESKVAMLKASLHDLHSLQIKLKAPRHELLQTRVKNALVWAERGDYDDCDEAFIHSQFC